MKQNALKGRVLGILSNQLHWLLGAAILILFAILWNEWKLIPATINLTPTWITMTPAGPTSRAAANVDLRNVGGRPLHIKSIKTSCGCLNASVESKSVPGQSATVLSLEADPPARGHKLVRLIVSSNDKQNPVVSLDVRIESFDRSMVLPSTLAFGHMSPLSLPRSLEACVFVDGQADLDETDVSCMVVDVVPGVSVEAIPPLQDEDARIRVLLNESLPAGRLAFPVEVSVAGAPITKSIFVTAELANPIAKLPMACELRLLDMYAGIKHEGAMILPKVKGARLSVEDWTLSDAISGIIECEFKEVKSGGILMYCRLSRKSAKDVLASREVYGHVILAIDADSCCTRSVIIPIHLH